VLSFVSEISGKCIMKMVEFPLPLAKAIDEFDAAYCLMVTVEGNLSIILPILTSAIKLNQGVGGENDWVKYGARPMKPVSVVGWCKHRNCQKRISRMDEGRPSERL
jgi:hypothetical protein